MESKTCTKCNTGSIINFYKKYAECEDCNT